MNEGVFRSLFVAGDCRLKELDSLLSTVRDEARLAALEECQRTINGLWERETGGRTTPGVAQALRAIDSMLKTTRTIDDVLGDIQPSVEQVSHVGPRSVDWLGRIARTAVEGIMEIEATMGTELTRKVKDKLTEIR